MKPLNFYQQGAVAWLQQDKYSMAPWFIEGKNLDIFSSSQSVKASARGSEEVVSDEIVDTDERGRFSLRKDWSVWDNERNRIIIGNNYNNRAIKNVVYSYDRKRPISSGKPLKLLVSWGEEDWETIVVITTTLIHTKIRRWYSPKVKLKNISGCIVNPDGSISADGKSKQLTFEADFEGTGFRRLNTVFIKKKVPDNAPLEWDLEAPEVDNYTYGLRYDRADDMLKLESHTKRSDFQVITSAWGDETYRHAELLDVNLAPWGWNSLKIKTRIKNGENSQKCNYKIYVEPDELIDNWTIYIDEIASSNLKQLGDDIIIKGIRSSKIYNFLPDNTRFNKIEFGEVFSVGWDLWVRAQDVVVSDSQIYAFSNKGEDGIISVYPKVAWEDGEHTTYPWMNFIEAVRKNNLIYIVAKNRGITGLYVYNGAELIPIISGSIIDEDNDVLGYELQVPFTRILEYGKFIVLWTRDKVYFYGKNGEANALSNVLHLKSGDRIIKIDVVRDKLRVFYRSGDAVKKRTHSNSSVKNYQKEFEIRFPIQIGAHMLEKELKELEVSYLLPSKDCVLEVWWGVGKYHFWSFWIEGASFNLWEKCTIKYTQGEYKLIYEESNGAWHTFILEGEVPSLQWFWKKTLVRENGEELNYTEINHMRRIGEIRADRGYTEGVARFVNLHNQLQLPRGHIIQIMVKGYGTEHNTPELYSVNLISEQKQR